MTRDADARSRWGWGLQARFPDRDARQQLGQMLGAAFGLTPCALLDPSAATILPAGRLQPHSDEVSDDEELRARHTWGRAWPDLVRGFVGDFSAAPDLVATPRDEAALVRLLDWANQRGVATIPVGGGTSVVGGITCDQHADWPGVLAISTRAMNKLVDVNPIDRLATIQAGALGPELEDALKPHGLTLRHYPQSFEFSTLGGWVATRAGGHFATLATHIDDLLHAARMISPAGLIQTQHVPCSGAGPEANRLLLGSEGTLGVITEATVRVRPRPVWRARATARFTRWSDATAAARAIAQSGLHPANCRLLDRREATLHQVTHDPAELLVLGFESADHPVERALTRALELCRDHGGHCPTGPKLSGPDDNRRDELDAGWRQAFFDGPYLQTTLVSLGIIADTFETSCRWSAFDTLHDDVVRSMRSAMHEICGHKGLVSCRFTHLYPDGPAPYYTFITPARPGTQPADWLKQWAALKEAASEVLVRHQASITHHHAVGRIHLPQHRRQRPAPYTAALTAAKLALDPRGIMNPGALI
jgi:alkyldihydroxyacetonephosphate synthase